MPVESVGVAALWKIVGIVFGPLLALLAAAFGFMYKRQEKHIKDTTESVATVQTELYQNYVTKEYLEMYVTLVIKPVVESVNRLAESNKELAQELREQRNRQ